MGGIGLGLAAKFIEAGSEVIVTGRNADKLNKAQQLLPGLKILINDIGKTIERENLAKRIQQHMPAINGQLNCLMRGWTGSLLLNMQRGVYPAHNLVIFEPIKPSIWLIMYNWHRAGKRNKISINID